MKSMKYDERLLLKCRKVVKTINKIRDTYIYIYIYIYINKFLKSTIIYSIHEQSIVIQEYPQDMWTCLETYTNIFKII